MMVKIIVRMPKTIAMRDWAEPEEREGTGDIVWRFSARGFRFGGTSEVNRKEIKHVGNGAARFDDGHTGHERRARRKIFVRKTQMLHLGGDVLETLYLHSNCR